MQSFKLLPLPLFVFCITATVSAEQINLPTISVEGFAGEASPFVFPRPILSSPDTGNLIKRLPGVNINSNGAITSIPQYRGLFGNRVNVLIDGINLHEAGPNSMDSALNYLPASRLDNVSLYRGIAPVSSGIETIGGTLTANSKKAKFAISDKAVLDGNAVAGYAENGNTHYLGANASIANQNHSLQLSASSDRGNNIQFDSGDIEPTEHKRDTVAINYAFQNNGNAFELSVDHNDTGHTGTPTLPMDIIFIRGENYKASFSTELNNGGTLSTQLHYQDIDHQMDNYTLRATPAMKQRFVSPDLKASDIRLQYSQASWSVGLDADQSKHNATVFNPNMAAFFVEAFNGVERDRFSLFAEKEHQLSSQWKLDTGIRYSLIKMDADNVASFIGLPPPVAILRNRFNNTDRTQKDHLFDIVANFTYTASSSLDLNIGFARKNRAPSYQERYLWIPLEITAGLADGNNYVGNVDLDHETAYQIELGLDWHTQYFAFSPRIFHHTINNYIQGTATVTDIPTRMVSSVNGDTTPLQYSNVDAKLYGMDANWFLVVSDQWQLDGTVSYVRGKRRDTNDNLYRIAPLTARTMLTYTRTNWKLSIEAETVASQNKVSSENDEQKTGAYALFNLAAGFEPSENITLSAGVNNLFNRNYDNHLGDYNRVSGNPDIAKGDHIPGIGRSAYLGVNYNW